MLGKTPHSGAQVAGNGDPIRSVYFSSPIAEASSSSIFFNVILNDGDRKEL